MVYTTVKRIHKKLLQHHWKNIKIYRPTYFMKSCCCAGVGLWSAACRNQVSSKGQMRSAMWDDTLKSCLQLSLHCYACSGLGAFSKGYCSSATLGFLSEDRNIWVKKLGGLSFECRNKTLSCSILPIMQSPSLALVMPTFIWLGSPTKPTCLDSQDPSGSLLISLLGREHTVDMMT